MKSFRGSNFPPPESNLGHFSLNGRIWLFNPRLIYAGFTFLVNGLIHTCQRSSKAAGTINHACNQQLQLMLFILFIFMHDVLAISPEKATHLQTRIWATQWKDTIRNQALWRSILILGNEPRKSKANLKKWHLSQRHAKTISRSTLSFGSHACFVSMALLDPV